jgi:putative flavoprotein involved in K+ transport
MTFAGDLGANLDAADAVYNGINQAIDGWIDAQGLDVDEPASVYSPVWHPEPESFVDLDVAELAAVVWCTGFASDYRWLHAPVFDGAGHVIHVRGVTDVDGLYFVGLPWLHTWGSGRFASVAEDAQFVVEDLLRRCGRSRLSAAS